MLLASGSSVTAIEIVTAMKLESESVGIALTCRRGIRESLETMNGV